jgi:hypothetical protein
MAAAAEAAAGPASPQRTKKAETAKAETANALQAERAAVGTSAEHIAIVPEQYDSIHATMASGATLILLKPGNYQMHEALKIERPLTIRGLGDTKEDVVVECASTIVFNTRLSFDHAEGCELGHFTFKSSLWRAGGVNFLPAPFVDLVTGRTTIDDMRIDHPLNRCSITVRQEASALIVNSWTNATIDLAGVGSVSRNTIGAVSLSPLSLSLSLLSLFA